MNKFEIWYKNQRVLRTIVQALVVLVPLANSAAAALVAYLTEQTDVVIPAVVFVWLNVVIAATALIMGVVARIMAVPQINELLTLFGLGSVPAARLTGDVAGAFVLPDPKVVSREEFQKALAARGIQ